MQDKIPEDATVASIIGRLDNADRYVSQAYGHIHKARNKHGPNVVLRIGVTGIGAKPNYRIEVRESSLTGPTVFGTFRGDNHSPLFQNNDDLEDAHWSTATMTVEQMADLLGQIRNFKRKK